MAITKSATARVTLGSDGKAAIVYDMRITNNGPAPAANVTASDAAPTGVTFTTIATQPSQGSCSVANGGALVNCTVGTVAVGQSLAFTVNASVNVTGTLTNCVTVTTTTPETNVANNTACAPTVVVPPPIPPPRRHRGRRRRRSATPFSQGRRC